MTRTAAKLSLLASACLLALAGTALANEKCAACHADIVAKHATTLHGKAGKDCASCHGGVDAHLAHPTKDNIISFTGKGDVAARNAQCLNCHGKNQKLMFWDNSKHQQNGVACVSCHTIHKSSKPYAKQPEKCFECHKDVKAQVNKFSHHPIIEGKVKCSDCHNPHGTLSKHMITAESTNELCYKCHADKRGPFVFEHPPVAEDCAICHSPHGTKANRLLKEKIPNLCQNCHEGSSHVSTLWSTSNAFGTASTSARFYGRSCLNCHSQIHGTNSNNNRAFAR